MGERTKTVYELQSELINALGNIAFVGTDGDKVSNECKSNAVEIIKKVIRDLEAYKPA